jgi:hypothetical protein
VAQKCSLTGSVIGSDEWKREPACVCTRCEASRHTRPDNYALGRQRQHISVRFDIDLPLKREQVTEAVLLLEGLLDVLKSSLRSEEPPAVDAVDPHVASTGKPSTRVKGF